MNIKKIGIIFWKSILYAQRTVMIIALIGTTLLVAGPLIMRELGRPFPGYEEFLLLFAFWMYMMGCSHGSYEKSQITADIVSRMLKGRPKQYLLFVASVLTWVLGAIFLYWAWSLVQWSLTTNTKTSIYNIPIVWGQFSIFLGLAITFMYNFVYMIEYFLEAFIRPKKTEPAELGEV